MRCWPPRTWYYARFRPSEITKAAHRWFIAILWVYWVAEHDVGDASWIGRPSPFFPIFADLVDSANLGLPDCLYVDNPFLLSLCQSILEFKLLWVFIGTCGPAWRLGTGSGRDFRKLGTPKLSVVCNRCWREGCEYSSVEFALLSCCLIEELAWMAVYSLLHFPILIEVRKLNAVSHSSVASGPNCAIPHLISGSAWCRHMHC